MAPKDLCCLHAAGLSSALSLGSIAVAGSPRTGRTSIGKRSHSCASPQSASCSEDFVIPHEVTGQTLNEGQMGNYIYSKLNENNLWVPIYIGQGDLAARATKDHHRIDCIDKKGATHVHLHLNAKEAGAPCGRERFVSELYDV